MCNTASGTSLAARYSAHGSPSVQFGGCTAVSLTREVGRVQDTEVCQMFTLAEEGKADNWRMLAVEVCAAAIQTSFDSVSVRITGGRSLSRPFRDARRFPSTGL